MQKIYEQRVYSAAPGRLPDLLKRFETVTLQFFDGYKIRPIGFCTYVIGGSSCDLVCLLEWNSMAERDAKWTAFSNDPEWIMKRTESEKDGAIVLTINNAFLQPTKFSALA